MSAEETNPEVTLEVTAEDIATPSLKKGKKGKKAKTTFDTVVGDLKEVVDDIEEAGKDLVHGAFGEVVDDIEEAGRDIAKAATDTVAATKNAFAGVSAKTMAEIEAGKAALQKYVKKVI